MLRFYPFGNIHPQWREPCDPYVPDFQSDPRACGQYIYIYKLSVNYNMRSADFDNLFICEHNVHTGKELWQEIVCAGLSWNTSMTKRRAELLQKTRKTTRIQRPQCFVRPIAFSVFEAA
jgi:hypothetical protein